MRDGRDDPLRRRMIEDRTVRNLSPVTQRSYVAQERYAIVVVAGDDPLARGLDAVDELHKRWLCLVRETGGSVFGPPDGLLEVFDNPQIAVLADGAKVERDR